MNVDYNQFEIDISKKSNEINFRDINLIISNLQRFFQNKDIRST